MTASLRPIVMFNRQTNGTGINRIMTSMTKSDLQNEELIGVWWGHIAMSNLGTAHWYET